MADIKTPRRYYLSRRRYFLTVEYDAAMAGAWRSKQEAEPGTALPSTFPFLSRLATECYETEEDLDGADECELIDAGFTQWEARTILAALVPLLAA